MRQCSSREVGSVSGCQYSRSTVQDFHFQSGIVREAVKSAQVIEGSRLEDGIVLQGFSGLFHIGVYIEFGGGDHLYHVSQYFCSFAKLVFVGGSK